MRTIAVITVILLSISPKTIAQIPTAGLLAYWPFNGNALDSSGNNNHGTLFGPVLADDRFMVENQSYAFNRSNDDYIETNIDDSALPTYTAAGWFYWNGVHNSHALGTFFESGSGWAWKAYYNKVSFSQGADALTSNYNLIPNTWFHVAISYNDTVACIYINGELDASKAVPSGTGQNFLIGAIPKYKSTYNWGGVIDEVFLYNRALNSTEVMNIYTGSTAGITEVPNEKDLKSIKIFPNPTKDFVHINVGEFHEMTTYKIRIINNLGEIVFENICNQKDFEINVSEFGTSGLYNIQIVGTDDLLVETRKIILE